MKRKRRRRSLKKKRKRRNLVINIRSLMETLRNQSSSRERPRRSLKRRRRKRKRRKRRKRARRRTVRATQRRRKKRRPKKRRKRKTRSQPPLSRKQTPTTVLIRERLTEPLIQMLASAFTSRMMKASAFNSLTTACPPMLSQPTAEHP